MLSRCARKKKKTSTISYESWETHTTNIIFPKSNWKTIFVLCPILVSPWHVLWPMSWKQRQTAVRCPWEQREGDERAKTNPASLRIFEVKLALIFSLVHSLSVGANCLSPAAFLHCKSVRQIICLTTPQLHALICLCSSHQLLWGEHRERSTNANSSRSSTHDGLGERWENSHMFL